VFVDRKVEDAFSVVTDNQESTYAAITDFIKKGHKNIAFVVQPLTISTRQGRFEGYQKALADAGINMNHDLVVESDLSGMTTKLEQLFSLPEKPTALFAGNDRVFLVVMEFLKDNGIKLDQDLELVVFDNIPFKQLLESPVSFINQPALEMGKKAAELLLEQIDKVERKPQEYVFPSWRE
jgi:LacI family kdg operon repressor